MQHIIIVLQVLIFIRCGGTHRLLEVGVCCLIGCFCWDTYDDDEGAAKKQERVAKRLKH